jgi:hypothetical protein
MEEQQFELKPQVIGAKTQHSSAFIKSLSSLTKRTSKTKTTPSPSSFSKDQS